MEKLKPTLPSTRGQDPKLSRKKRRSSTYTHEPHLSVSTRHRSVHRSVVPPRSVVYNAFPPRDPTAVPLIDEGIARRHVAAGGGHAWKGPIARSIAANHPSLRPFAEEQRSPNDELSKLRRDAGRVLKSAKLLEVNFGTRQKQLDGFELLRAAGGLVDPIEATEAIAVGRGLRVVQVDDMQYFTRLRRLDVAQNFQLSIADLIRGLPALEELHLACNMLDGIDASEFHRALYGDGYENNFPQAAPLDITENVEVPFGTAPENMVPPVAEVDAQLATDAAAKVDAEPKADAQEIDPKVETDAVVDTDVKEETGAKGETVAVAGNNPPRDIPQEAPATPPPAAESVPSPLPIIAPPAPTLPPVRALALVALNLAYNALPRSVGSLLARLPVLERLDVSYNRGFCLSATTAQEMLRLRQLALEGNELSDTRDVLALAHMPSLEQLNLNRNRFSQMPAMENFEMEGLFRELRVMGLAANFIATVEHISPLSRLGRMRASSAPTLSMGESDEDATMEWLEAPSHCLERLVLSENPIARSTSRMTVVYAEFADERGVVVVTAPLVPPTCSLRVFYRETCREFRGVPDVVRECRKAVTERQNARAATLSATRMKRTAPSSLGSSSSEDERPSASAPSPAPAPSIGEGNDGAASASGSADRAGTPRGGWTFVTHTDVDPWNDAPSEGMAPLASSVVALGRIPSMGDSYGRPRRPPQQPVQTVQTKNEERGENVKEGEVTAPRPNLRAALTALQRALRKPLPPLQLPPIVINSQRARYLHK